MYVGGDNGCSAKYAVPPFTFVVPDEEDDDELFELEAVDPHAANNITLAAEIAANLIQLERISRFPLFLSTPALVSEILAGNQQYCNHLYILN